MRTFHTTSKEVQTYQIGASVVATDGTHHNTCVGSTMQTPRLLLGALCVLHMEMLSNAIDRHVIYGVPK